MRTDDLDFVLPPDLIAQKPAPDRAASRLLHYRRDDYSVRHLLFSDLPRLLRPGDLLVLNDSRVVPARILLRNPAGRLLDGLFLSEDRPGRWRVLLKKSRATPGTMLTFVADPSLTARVIGSSRGQFEIELNCAQPATLLLERIGRMPLPPYIKRARLHDERDEMDRSRYQTVYARIPGSVAAPTAGLHFTDDIFQSLKDRGIEWCFVTLHVGLGTFKPITVDTLEDHVMHAETYSISTETAAILNAARSQHRRIIAVGTTAARVLETQPPDQPFEPRTDQTAIFIRPGHVWKHVKALVTNFHLPRSTLIALVAAMIGLQEQRRIYQIAIENRYRFFSYGDAMFIE